MSFKSSQPISQTSFSTPQIVTDKDSNEVESLLAAIRTKKIAIVIFAVMASLGLACILISIAAWAIAPLSIALVSLLVVAGLVILIAATILIIKPISHLSVLKEKLQKDTFHQLLISNDRTVTQKLDLFKRYGHFCIELNLDSNLKIGMKLKDFINWQLELNRENPILNPYVRNILKEFRLNTGDSISSFEQLKRFYNFIQLIPTSHYGHELSKKSFDGNVIRSLFHSPPQHDDDVSTNIPTFNPELETYAPSEHIFTFYHILKIIESCPNLKVIKSSFNLRTFKTIEDLCTQRQISIDYIAGINNFNSDTFPGLTF